MGRGVGIGTGLVVGSGGAEVWLVFFFVVPFFIQISHALLFFCGHSVPGYRDDEVRRSGSDGLLVAAPLEPNLLASSGLLL